jgi:hypothetical protein
MIDLVLTSPAEGPATLFTRNFRIHSGIPIGLYQSGPRAPLCLIYGDVSPAMLAYFSERYPAVIGIPWLADDEIPEKPLHYETLTMQAPILARVQTIDREGFAPLIKTSEGGPLVYEGRVGGSLVHIFAADLIKATIRILSGEVEANTGEDNFGRHRPAPENVIRTPAVSLHFNLIEQVIRYAYQKTEQPLLSVPRWPGSSPLALFLSHDVDVVKKWTGKRITYEILRSSIDLLRFRPGRLRQTVDSLMEAMRHNDPYWNFDELMFLENGHGFPATWFFAPFGGEYNVRDNPWDPVYHRKPAEITARIRRLKEHGCEIGLHGTRGAHLDSTVLRRQLESFENRLGYKFAGVRHHYLQFRHGVTLEAAASAGFVYDSTLGFSDRPGFRNGMAAPFFRYPVSHPAGRIVEIPLHFMDTVFLHGGGDIETTRRRVIEAYLYAKTAGGLFSVLVHPENIDQAEIPELGNFYRSFLPRCQLDDARAMTGGEIAAWWLAREQVLRAVEYMPDLWRIRNVTIPLEMDFNIAVPNIKNMKFALEGARGSSNLTGNTLRIHPGVVDPAKGIAFLRKG